MLSKISKFAPFVVMLLLGYLTYSAFEEQAPVKAEGKEPPTITKQMLNPKLVAPQANAGPADRDPFEVKWASYLIPRVERTGPPPAAGPAVGTATQPAAAPGQATQPAVVQPPPLPGELQGVIINEDICLAVIGDRVYRPNALVGGGDPQQCWRVERIEGSDRVTLQFGEFREVLHLTPTTAPAKAHGKEARK